MAEPFRYRAPVKSVEECFYYFLLWNVRVMFADTSAIALKPIQFLSA